jgi:hypothetical protein
MEDVRQYRKSDMPDRSCSHDMLYYRLRSHKDTRRDLDNTFVGPGPTMITARRGSIFLDTGCDLHPRCPYPAAGAVASHKHRYFLFIVCSKQSIHVKAASIWHVDIAPRTRGRC